MLPRREDLSGDRGVLIVAYASHKKKAYSFFLLQVHHNLLQVLLASNALRMSCTAHAGADLLKGFELAIFCFGSPYCALQA